tara:strand:+ start:3296 stop:3853 length:558 start_codon:yes stop_codon:yes gene_type:complete
MENDLKNVLGEGNPDVPELKDTNDSSDKIRKHKKPIQLRDIENRSTGNKKYTTHETTSEGDIQQILNKERKEVYKQSWNKLDTGMKINRIKVYIEKETKENNLSTKEKDKLKDLLMHACNSNRLNRNTEVSYDKEDGVIITIKSLKFNKEKREYTLDVSEVKKPKATSSSKSKSNIDRFLRSNNR